VLRIIHNYSYEREKRIVLLASSCLQVGRATQPSPRFNLHGFVCLMVIVSSFWLINSV